jgi:AmiR/NasT family two-component response regulator
LAEGTQQQESTKGISPKAKCRATVIDRFQAMVSGLRASAHARPMRSRTDADERPRALAIMRPGPHLERLQGIFHEEDWELVIAETMLSALTRQKKNPLPIVLWERELTDCDWRKAVSVLSGLPPRPWVILLSGRYDRNLWEDLTGFGGSDIVRTPLDRETVIHSVRSGWSLWRHLQQLRRATGHRP